MVFSTTNYAPNRKVQSADFAAARTRLTDNVVELCNFDRRGLHRIGTDEAVHYLDTRLKQIGLSSKVLDDYKGITADLVDFKVDQIIKHFARKEARRSKKEESDTEFRAAKKRLQDTTSGLDTSKLFAPKNIRAQIGDPEGKKIILCAHYDTDIFINRGAGADDNASGVAVLLELAKRLKAQEKLFEEAGLNLEFVFFGSEELPFTLRGSESFVNKLSDVEKADLELVINMDMLGYFDPQRTRSSKAEDYGRPAKDSFEAMAKRIHLYLPSIEDYYLIDSDNKSSELGAGQELQRHIIEQNLRVKEISPKLTKYKKGDKPKHHNFHLGAKGDHYYFMKSGVPTLWVNDHPKRNPNYHTNRDLPETLDYDRMTKLAFGIENYLVNYAKKKTSSK